MAKKITKKNKAAKDKSISTKPERYRACVLRPVLRSDSARDSDAMLEEAVGLAVAVKMDVVVADAFKVSKPSPSTLLGKGLVEEYKEILENEEIDLVVVDHILTPIQQRNLERAWNVKVIDRTGLILEIFGDRARTKEGKLQVELAALSYQKSRLVRSWTHLERQRGGFGFLGGPGESQLEIDRRLITNRITKLKSELEQVRRTRGLQRTAREKAEHPVIALVGYTNAGKSTLFNCMTGAGVMAKDMLFATLDTSMRGLKLPSGREAVLSDTVGFISDLPTHLIDAFRATLEEVQLADVILHVRDITHPEARQQKESVEEILSDLGIEPDDARLIEVMNKADLMDDDKREQLRTYAQRQSWDSQHAPAVEGVNPQARGGVVAMSALTGEGVDDLIHLIDDHLASKSKVYELSIPMSDGAALAWLYGHGNIAQRDDKRTKTHLKVILDQADFGRFISKFGKNINVKN